MKTVKNRSHLARWAAMCGLTLTGARGGWTLSYRDDQGNDRHMRMATLYDVYAYLSANAVVPEPTRGRPRVDNPKPRVIPG